MDMIYTEWIKTFSEARNLFPRLLLASIVLNLIVLGLGSGDTRNFCLFDIFGYHRIAKVEAVFVSPSLSWEEAIFLANPSHSAGESRAL